jgi:DNA-nicking Smr family endonuclease
MKSRGKSGSPTPPTTSRAKGRIAERARHLSPDDEHLWRHAAQTIRPVRMKPRVPDVEPQAEPTRSKYRPEPVVRPAGRLSDSPAPPVSANRPTSPPTPTWSDPPPLAAFEKKKARRIATGRIEIDARLDLHGARQSEAHTRLRGFLMQCTAKGHSTVLVITGKGGPASANASNKNEGLEPRDRGVLRRSVPLWLEQPELRAVVISYRPAHIKHGGDGALYLELRRRRS